MYPDDHDYTADIGEPADYVPPRRRPIVRIVAAVTIVGLVTSVSGLLGLRLIRSGRICSDSPVHDLDVTGATDVEVAALMKRPEFRCDGRTVEVQATYEACESRPRGTILDAGDVVRGHDSRPILRITACGGPPGVT